MKRRSTGWWLSLLKSLALHSVLLTVLLLRWQGVPMPTPAAPQEAPEIIEAVAVDERQVEEELRRIEEKERARQTYQEKLKRQRMAEERRLRELQRKRRAEKQRLQQLAQQRRRKAEEEARRLAELKKRQKEEKERLARLEKARQEAERKRLEAEKRRKAEAEKRRKAEVARKKALEAKRREEARRKAEAEAQRQAALARQKAIDRQVMRVIGEIRQQVEQRWIRPASYRAGMSCTIRVRVIPGGEVVDARVVRSSGNAAFDRSAAVAVRKASPLPIPADPGVAARFREFSFVFKPEG